MQPDGVACILKLLRPNGLTEVLALIAGGVGLEKVDFDGENLASLALQVHEGLLYVETNFAWIDNGQVAIETVVEEILLEVGVCEIGLGKRISMDGINHLSLALVIDGVIDMIGGSLLTGELDNVAVD